MWVFIPTAILLGALHGLEPGHSKTMMAAFIIAIRGTVAQAVLLGLSAAISHSLIIWVLAAGALHFGSQWDAERVEPYLQIGSAVCIFALAAWMYFRTRRELREAHGHAHAHGGHPGHQALRYALVSAGSLGWNALGGLVDKGIAELQANGQQIAGVVIGSLGAIGSAVVRAT